MLPVLLDLKIIKIYTEGVFFVLAFFWATFFLWKNILLTAYKEEDIFDALFVSLAGGLLGSRLIYVILNFTDFGFNIAKFVLINGYPGLNFYGGLFGFFITLYIFLLPRKINFMKLVDYMISPLLLALGIGKIGSFFSGSEIGARTTFFLSVKYPGYDGLRHLTPFYEGVLLLLGSYITYKLLMSIRRNKHKESFAFAFFWWWIGLIFTAFDILKSDHDLIFGVSFDMIIAGMILLTSTLYLIYYFRAAITNKMAFIKR